MTLALLLLAPVALATDPLDQLGQDDLTDDRDEVFVDLVERGGPAPIINGQDATIDDYPQAGAVIFDGTLDFGSYGQQHYQAFMCSSTLIAPDVVMLAAHCVDPDVLTYGYGTVRDAQYGWTRQLDLTAWDGSTVRDWPSDTVFAKDWVFHPQWEYYDLGMGVTINYDIALIFLEEALTDQPLGYLPLPEEADQLAVGNSVDVVGWGQQTASQNPPAGTHAIKQWGTSHIAELSAYEFQVGKVQEDVRKCHGASGGPTFMVVDSDYTDDVRVVGVTSHAYDSTDCQQTGGVDTRVDYYLDWIDDELTSRCQDGTRVWCDVEGIVPPPSAGLSESWSLARDWEFEEPTGACSTSGGAASGLWLLAGLGLIGLRRRR